MATSQSNRTRWIAVGALVLLAVGGVVIVERVVGRSEPTVASTREPAVELDVVDIAIQPRVELDVFTLARVRAPDVPVVPMVQQPTAAPVVITPAPSSNDLADPQFDETVIRVQALVDRNASFEARMTDAGASPQTLQQMRVVVVTPHVRALRLALEAGDPTWSTRVNEYLDARTAIENDRSRTDTERERAIDALRSAFPPKDHERLNASVQLEELARTLQPRDS